MKKVNWKAVINVAITILTAIAATLTTACVTA